MHQRHRSRLVIRLPRLVVGALVAGIPAMVAIVIILQTNPVCFYLTPDSPEWYLFWCFLTG